MSDFLDIKLIIDKNWPKLTVYIKNRERNEDVESIIAAVQSFSDRKCPMIAGYFRESLVKVPQGKIIRLYVSNRKVMMETSERVYEVRKTLQDLEEILDDTRFARVSQSEIINVRRVKQFDFSAAVTIGVEFENGKTTWVARRRVKAVKSILSGGGNVGSEK